MICFAAAAYPQSVIAHLDQIDKGEAIETRAGRLGSTYEYAIWALI